MTPTPLNCPNCLSRQSTSRREFMKATAAGLSLAAAALPARVPARAKEGSPATSETLVTQLYKSLTDEQRQRCAFDFEHPLRAKVDNNWFITDARIQRSFTGEQQALIREIFLSLHSPEYADKVMQQVEHDGGFDTCAVALFGQPGSGKFEFVLTGRHVTRRCDGDSVQGTAFGGPIFYGHAAQDFYEPADHAGNIYWYQAKRANELFQALDGKQRKLALRSDARPEQGTDTVKLAAKESELQGLPVEEMTTDQQELARRVMDDLLSPFRETDRKESMKLVEANNFQKLHFSYFQNMDIGEDGVWDVWQIEGPAMLWYFRGQPHVHTWVHIRESA